jgi:hypothetical protein
LDAFAEPAFLAGFVRWDTLIYRWR